MKFLTDENIANSTIRMIRELGFDVKDVREIGLIGCSDELIIKLAIKEDRIIITLDKDFGNILKFPIRGHKGIIFIRIKRPTPKRVNLVLKTLLVTTDKEKIKNSLVVIKEKGIRIRR
jgi:predicted nuclease of predicted toxin-antitoxin system